MNYVIVGTAGHVDHGKTELVKALTGVNTDRLKEERERGISIELGFAPLKLPGGHEVGLVDVPGHERFIRQMLAGVGGMDVVMLVVAADEGVMPQTREHLEIIDLLQVKAGLLVISKIDLVERDWLDLVAEEVRQAVKGTVLEGAPLVEVSAFTGEGLEKLKEELEEAASGVRPRSSAGKARLPIDRTFTITGFGTVVTGTLWSGAIRVGDALEVLPRGLATRVRNLEVHDRTVEEALAGQRVAVNLAGLEVEEVPRGSVLATPGYLKPSHRLDILLRLVPSAPRPLAQQTRIRFYLGTGEVFGRVSLLDREELRPGESCFAQLAAEEPLTALRADRFVIRFYSPMFTIGGGLVLDPLARKHPRYRPEILASLEARLRGAPEELILDVLKGKGNNLLTREEVAGQAGLPAPEVAQAAGELQKKGQVLEFHAEGSSYLAEAGKAAGWLREVQEDLGSYHRQYPLRPGMPKEELRTRRFAALSPRAFQAILQEWAESREIRLDAVSVSLPGFGGHTTGRQQELLKAAEEFFLRGRFQPPSWPEVERKLGLGPEEGEELLRYLAREGILIKINEEIYFHRQALEAARDCLLTWFKEHDSIQLGEVRDLLGSSRKYILPLLEYLDQIRFTRRIGEKRVPF